MEYIFDASPAILLFEKCNLRKQLQKFSETNKLHVPLRVFEEYKKGKDVKPDDVNDFQKVFSVVNPTLNRELLPYFNFKDSSGEIWVMSYVFTNSECCCVIDEEFGREIATLFNLNLTGAIGIIEEMKKFGCLSENDLHCLPDNVRNSGFYISKKLLEDLDRICSP
jgi:predicted nucleic acid-binding protein